MKIAFIMTGFWLSKGNGVVSQAMTWKKGLEILGHEVVLFHGWEYHDLKEFDIIQIFRFNSSTAEMVSILSKRNPNIVIAPILDPDYSIINAKLRSYYGNQKFKLLNGYSSLRSSKDMIKKVLVRSEYEKKYMVESFGFKSEQCDIIRLPSGIRPEINLDIKEDFCFHLSLLTDERKNVKRLIESAEKYKFKLVLAGGIQNERRRRELEKWLENTNYVQYKGFLSETDKIDLYKKAKVFALPSLNEGVGIVALEAACYGCDIVITNIGGPKEYYNNLAETVNPYSVDEIGMSIKKMLSGKTYQPELANYIDEHFSLERISKQLETSYLELINNI